MGLAIHGCGEFCEDLFVKVVAWERDVLVAIGRHKCHFASRRLGDNAFAIDRAFAAVNFHAGFAERVAKAHVA